MAVWCNRVLNQQIVVVGALLAADQASALGASATFRISRPGRVRPSISTTCWTMTPGRTLQGKELLRIQFCPGRPTIKSIAWPISNLSFRQIVTGSFRQIPPFRSRLQSLSRCDLGPRNASAGDLLLDRAKRQGIGSALLRVLMRDFLAAGANSASVWMLRDNWPARSFYERRGVQCLDHENDRFWRLLAVPAWSSVRPFGARLQQPRTWDMEIAHSAERWMATSLVPACARCWSACLAVTDAYGRIWFVRAVRSSLEATARS